MSARNVIATQVEAPVKSKAEILAHHKEPELWAGLLNHKSADIRLRTLQYLVRDPLLAALSQEELQALDALTRKLALPAPDTPQNQIESKPAIESDGAEG